MLRERSSKNKLCHRCHGFHCPGLCSKTDIIFTVRCRIGFRSHCGQQSDTEIGKSLDRVLKIESKWSSPMNFPFHYHLRSPNLFFPPIFLLSHFSWFSVISTLVEFSREILYGQLHLTPSRKSLDRYHGTQFNVVNLAEPVCETLLYCYSCERFRLYPLHSAWSLSFFFFCKTWQIDTTYFPPQGKIHSFPLF